MDSPLHTDSKIQNVFNTWQVICDLSHQKLIFEYWFYFSRKVNIHCHGCVLIEICES